MKTIDETPIIKLHSNNGKSKTLLLEEENKLFKIDIKSESHNFQSYARLYVLNKNNEFTLLKYVNPNTEYNIDVYRFNSRDFDKIITDFKKLIKKLSPLLN